MKDFLKKIRLVMFLERELGLDQSTFIAKLQDLVDEEELGFVSEAFEHFNASKNNYRGHVGMEGFNLKRRSQFFDFRPTMAIATGTFEQQGERLKVTVEVNGLRGLMVPLVIFILTVFVAGTVIILSFFSATGEMNSGYALSMLVQAAFLMAIPYFLMRYSASKLKADLDREFKKMEKQVAVNSTK